MSSGRYFPTGANSTREAKAVVEFGHPQDGVFPGGSGLRSAGRAIPSRVLAILIFNVFEFPGPFYACSLFGSEGRTEVGRVPTPLPPFLQRGGGRARDRPKGPDPLLAFQFRTWPSWNFPEASRVKISKRATLTGPPRPESDATGFFLYDARGFSLRQDAQFPIRSGNRR